MRKYKILIVDDDPYLLSSMGKDFERRGYQVKTADNGERAIELIEQMVFDMVITDLVMDEVNGIGVLKKTKEQNSETIVMILTGFGEMTSAIEAMRFEADDYVLKSSSPEEIFFRASECLNKLDLKRKIREKSEELVRVNKQLQREIKIRKQKELKLLEAREKLEDKVKERTKKLERTNIALNVLLEKRAEDRKELEENLVFNAKHQVMPFMEKLKSGKELNQKQRDYVSKIESSLSDLISPFVHGLSSKLTPSEIQVAGLIKDGKTSKEIAGLLEISPWTINFHRYNIRNKLGLRKRKINLRSYLLNLE